MEHFSVSGFCLSQNACLPVWQHMRWHFQMCDMLSVCTQVELGAGDTHGPLFGMKIFRNLTPRWYASKCITQDISIYLFFSLQREESQWFIFGSFFFSFITAQCGLQFSSRGVRPGVTTVLARHLDKNTMGYLQWRWGIQSSMNTSIVRDTKSSHFTFAMQVRQPAVIFNF